MLFNSVDLRAQTSTLLLSDAIKTVCRIIKPFAKQHYIQSSQALVKNTKNEYLPNVIAAIQQNLWNRTDSMVPYLLGAWVLVHLARLIAARAGTRLWCCIYFGTNWEVFSFGRLNAKIVLSKHR